MRFVQLETGALIPANQIAKISPGAGGAQVRTLDGFTGTAAKDIYELRADLDYELVPAQPGFFVVAFCSGDAFTLENILKCEVIAWKVFYGDNPPMPVCADPWDTSPWAVLTPSGQVIVYDDCTLESLEKWIDYAKQARG